MNRAAGWVALAAFVVASRALPARATVVVDQTIPEMARHATLVVRGVVYAQRAQWDEHHRQIITRTFVRTTKALKGSAGPTVVVRQPGGAIGKWRAAVEGEARFRLGEEVVLFLQPFPGVKDEFVLEGMSATKFTVVATKTGPVVTRTLAGLALARPDARGVIRPSAHPPMAPSTMPLAELLRAVRQGSRPAGP